jgi:protoporphyrinogen/coproporphyrinogen III oxidase
MRTIKVVGAGFSGLATAYFLVKRGFQVRIVEKTNRVGGLIETIHTEHGLVEKAANGILSSARLESIAADIGVPLLPTKREGRKRFIYRGRPRQVPLKTSEILNVGARMATHATNLKPRPFESIAEWGRRVAGAAATDYLLIPALGGIYAGDPDRLSASLIFGKARQPDHLRTTRPAKGKLRGTVGPPHGMQQLTDGLRQWLEQSGVEFIFNHDLNMAANTNEPTVVCLSANAAADYLNETAPEVSHALRGIEMLSLVTVTAFYPKNGGTSPTVREGSSDRLETGALPHGRAKARSAATLNGFGCLFPREQGFRARGVLFNNCIFEGRGPAQSETWIFGGALDPEVIELTDEAFKELIAREREAFYGRDDEPLALCVNRRAHAIPHYSIELEKILATLPALPPHVTLVGNYLGRIGLAKLIERAAVVADEFSSSL